MASSAELFSQSEKPSQTEPVKDKTLVLPLHSAMAFSADSFSQSEKPSPTGPVKDETLGIHVLLGPMLGQPLSLDVASQFIFDGRRKMIPNLGQMDLDKHSILDIESDSPLSVSIPMLWHGKTAMYRRYCDAIVLQLSGRQHFVDTSVTEVFQYCCVYHISCGTSSEFMVNLIMIFV